MATAYYKDVEVPLTGPLLKMIVKQSWTGKDRNVNRPSLIYVMDGLALFVMINLNENQVVHFNKEQDLINTASLVSVTYLQGHQRTPKVSILAEEEDFMFMLKHYTKLMFAEPHVQDNG